ncbi:MAG: ABC transporter ATP-binding protein [Bacteroidales bacterium]|nr:ABC transporter ATP-binding protein [Bacteroidales bacterium]
MEQAQKEGIILEVKNLTVVFVKKTSRFCAVENLSFTLYKGTTMGLVGESGSGKSVSMLSIMRLLNAKNVELSGSVIFYDKGKPVDLLAVSPSGMREYRGSRIAMIFQEPMTSLNPSMTCGMQVVETLRLHLKMNKKQAQKRTLELFEEVLLPYPQKIFCSYPHQISGGQKQRVMIAMAMACNPDILIADEPTTALDVTVQKNILELMRSLQQKHGMSIVFITHDLGVVAQISHHVLVMYKGHKVEEGPLKNIFLSPQHAYTKGLLACRVPTDKRMKNLPTISDFLQESQSGTPFQEEPVNAGDYMKQTQLLLQQVPMMKVRSLSKRYVVKKHLYAPTQYFYAVNNVNFDVYPGETLGLVGESGCGKTTLGRLLLRLTEPTSGSIEYNNMDLCKCSVSKMRQLRKEIQVVFQDPYSSLNPRYTIGNAIMEPMKLHHIGDNDLQRREMVMELLEKVNMEAKHFNAYPHEFSGGQRQRICIARALALQPKLLICDESVSALDVSVQAQVLNLLNKLKEEYNLTYIFISHDLSVVKFMSHRVMVMNKGEIQELNTADELYAHPQCEYTKKLIAAIPRIDCFS